MRLSVALCAALSCCLGCAAQYPSDFGAEVETNAQAGFVDLAPRRVILSGRPVSLAATAKIFYNFRPADSEAGTRPLIVLFNGFASDVVRGFGTGPMTVEADGAVVPNPNSLTRFANLLYIEPRQAGFSYDVLDGRAPTLADCSQDVFSEYVDAADVLLTALRFVNDHPRLTGPVYWMGESYAGVRITWILTYLRQAWALAPYQDDTLQAAIAGVDRARFLSGQVLLQPWLAGSAHVSAIQAACSDPNLLVAVQASVSAPCSTANACECAKQFGRSPYNYVFTTAQQDARVFAADAAQVAPEDAEALYGAKLDSIPDLQGAARARGFKCSVADAETPDQSRLVQLLGALPAGQSYNLGYSPLTTGKGSLDPDWRTQTRLGSAFLSNAEHVVTLITDGQRDLVVPEIALTPALREISGSVPIAESTNEITIGYSTGPRAIAVRHYPGAGHMITMLEPQAFASDLSQWLAQRATSD